MTQSTDSAEADFVATLLGENCTVQKVSERLRVAVDRAGGIAAVSRASGVIPRSLGRYLSGQEMKRPALIALARACNVSLEWLATGQEPAENQSPRTEEKILDFPKVIDDISKVADRQAIAKAVEFVITKERLCAESGKPPDVNDQVISLFTVYAMMMADRSTP